jgi:hypothetical protein
MVFILARDYVTMASKGQQVVLPAPSIRLQFDFEPQSGAPPPY